MSNQTESKNMYVVANVCCVYVFFFQIHDPTPRYEDEYYETSNAKPNSTELKLFYHYINMEDYKYYTSEIIF